MQRRSISARRSGKARWNWQRHTEKTFRVVKSDSWILGGVLILISAPIANANLALTGPAKNYLSFMFFVMSYFTVAQAFNTTMVVGVFRAGGDTKFGLIMDVSTMWGFSILLGGSGGILFCMPVCRSYMLY